MIEDAAMEMNWSTMRMPGATDTLYSSLAEVPGEKEKEEIL